MDRFLTPLLGLTRRLPRVRGARYVSRSISRAYKQLRGDRLEPIETDALGFRLILDARDYAQECMFFSPQLFDYEELAFVRSHLRPGDTFLDVGAHHGFYSLVASRAVGPEGRVLAFEASGKTFASLSGNVDRNDARNVKAIHAGVSDKRETLRLGINPSNTGGNNFVLHDMVDGEDVECAPLLEFLQREGVTKVAIAKLDIEGFEQRVLAAFFRDAPISLHPRAIIMEVNPAPEYGGEAARNLLLAQGYTERWRGDLNVIMTR